MSEHADEKDASEDCRVQCQNCATCGMGALGGDWCHLRRVSVTPPGATT